MDVQTYEYRRGGISDLCFHKRPSEKKGLNIIFFDHKPKSGKKFGYPSVTDNFMLMKTGGVGRD